MKNKSELKRISFPIEKMEWKDTIVLEEFMPKYKKLVVYIKENKNVI